MKFQAPSSKLQRNSKPQAPEFVWIGAFEFGASLELGNWNLELHTL
jgi:hypothetical protein